MAPSGGQRRIANGDEDIDIDDISPHSVVPATFLAPSSTQIKTQEKNLHQKRSKTPAGETRKNNKKSTGDFFLNLYTTAIVSHPFAVFTVTSVLFIVVPFVAVVFGWPPRLAESPEKGFDTVDTPYSGARLTWSALQPSLLRGSRVFVDVSELSTASGEEESNKQASTGPIRRPYNATGGGGNGKGGGGRRRKRSWVDDLIQTFGSVACYDEPIPAMSYLVQFIISVPSLEHLFTQKVIAQLCHLQQHMEPFLKPFEAVTPYRQIWHAGQYLACLSPSRHNNCSFVGPGDLAEVRRTLAFCLPYRTSILECRRHCQPHYQSPGSPGINGACPGRPCPNVPTQCQGQMWFDFLYRILPRDLNQRPLLVNNFLPMYTFATYMMQGFGANIHLNHYVALAEALQNWTRTPEAKNTNIQLKGISMDVKRNLLLDAALDDSKFSLLALLVVFLLIAIYSWSIAFAIAVLFQLAGSMLSAMAVYRLLETEFPLLNLVVFVLLVSIGVDGAFLLLRVFPSPDEPALFQDFSRALGHTASTMFLTQFSTIVPFLLNLASNVIAFRAFGLFAALSLVANYLLLVFFLPTFLVVQHRYANPWLARCLPTRLWCCCFPSAGLVTDFKSTLSSIHSSSATDSPTSSSPLDSSSPTDESSNNLQQQQRKRPQILSFTTQRELPPSRSNLQMVAGKTQPVLNRRPSPIPPSQLERLCLFGRTLMDDVLPGVLIEGRWFWLASFATVFFFCLYVCLTQLSLPKYNPLQLFSSSNPHEYFDNNAERLYEFVGDKLAVPLVIRLIWGVKPVHSTDYFDARQHSPLVADPKFRLNSVQTIEALAGEMQRIRQLPFVQHAEPFWPERFLAWSAAQRCPTSTTGKQQKQMAAMGVVKGLCCNFNDPRFSQTFLDFCIRLSTTQLPTGYNDTLLYHNTTFELVGYSASFPTKLRYSHQFANLSASFGLLEAGFLKPELGNGPASALPPVLFTTEWNLMSTWYDLQRAIIGDFRQSVLISFAVVLVLATAVLRLRSLAALLTVFAIDVCTVGVLVLLGWEIGVLEGVILVLVVGLSFDYTLHYGATIPAKGCPTHRIRYAVRKAVVPNALAALSSVLAGGTMLFAETQAFVQVAIFLVACCSLSFLFSTFFFVPLMYVAMDFAECCCHQCCRSEPPSTTTSKRRKNPCRWCSNEATINQKASITSPQK